MVYENTGQVWELVVYGESIRRPIASIPKNGYCNILVITTPKIKRTRVLGVNEKGNLWKERKHKMRLWGKSKKI